MFSPYFGGSDDDSASQVLKVSATANTTTTSTTPTPLNTMTFTGPPPPAGTYLAFFVSFIVAASYDHAFAQMYIDNAAIAEYVTEATGREATTLGSNPVFNPVVLIGYITLNGAQVPNIRWWSNAGAQVTCHQRSFHLLRVGG